MDFSIGNISLNMEVTIIPPWSVLRLKSELLHKYLSWFVGEKLQFQKMERFGVFIAILLSLKLLLQINICSIITKCHFGFHYNIEHYRQSVIQWGGTIETCTINKINKVSNGKILILVLSNVLAALCTLYSDSARHWSQDICYLFLKLSLRTLYKFISLIIKEYPEEILIKLAVVLKISKFSWNTGCTKMYVAWQNFKKLRILIF